MQQYISRGASDLETDAGGEAQGKELSWSHYLFVQYLFKFIFINKVYEVNYKHLTEFILTVSNQPYLQINHQLNT